MEEIKIRGDYIKLEQLLKIASIVSSGGEVKAFLAREKVYVNGVLDNRRGRKLYINDEIKVLNTIYKIC